MGNATPLKCRLAPETRDAACGACTVAGDEVHVRQHHGLPILSVLLERMLSICVQVLAKYSVW